MSFNRGMHNENVVYLQDRMLLCHLSSNCSVPEAGSLSWSSAHAEDLKAEALTPARHWTCQQSEGSRQRAQLASHPLHRLHHKAWPRFKVGLSTSKDVDQRGVFPLQMINQQKSLTGVPSCLGSS